MCAGLEGEGPGEEVLVVELGAVVGFCEVLVDDGEGESGVAVRGVPLVHGQTQQEAARGVRAEVAQPLQVNRDLLI